MTTTATVNTARAERDAIRAEARAFIEMLVAGTQNIFSSDRQVA